MRDGKPQRAAGSQPFRKRLNSGSSLCRGKCHGEPSRSVFLRARPAAKMQRRRTHHSVGRLWRCKKRSRWRRVPLASRRLCNAALQNRLMRWLRRALRNVARSSYTDVHPRAVGDAEPHCCGCHAPRVPTRARVARDKLTAAACGKGASLGSADWVADSTSCVPGATRQPKSGHAAYQHLSSCEPALACEAWQRLLTWSLSLRLRSSYIAPLVLRRR